MRLMPLQSVVIRCRLTLKPVIRFRRCAAPKSFSLTVRQSLWLLAMLT